jgi:peptidoglycan/xylan/chitin deacetylase (PgdA/CDA1 family)
MTARQRIGYAVRIVLSYGLYYTGILHVLQRILLRRKVVVLMYHRVLTREQRARTASQPGLVVEDETFVRQIALLKRMFTVLTLDEFADRLARREPFDGPCCLITFDDGWLDVFENALPVLSAYGVPAVVFLPVNFIGQRRLFIREALTHLLVTAVETSRRAPERRERLRATLAPLGFDRVLEINDAEPLGAVIEAVGAHYYASLPAFEALVAALSADLGVCESELSELDTFVDWSHVELMGKQGFAFGGHGAEHRVLTHVSADVARTEIESSKTVLDSRLPTSVRAFAYPNGGWSPEIATTVKASGYQLAFTIERGYVSCQDDCLALRRINIHEDMTKTAPMFLARLTGII